MKKTLKEKHVLNFIIVELLISFIFLGSINAENTAWTPLGPEGGKVQGLAVSPNWPVDQTIIFGTPYDSYAMFYRTTDGGETWWSTQPEGQVTTNYGFSTVALSPDYWYGGDDQTVFIGGGNGAGLNLSTNSGETWYKIWPTSASTNVINIWDIGVSPGFAIDGTVFALGINWPTAKHGILKSINGGATFFSVSELYPSGGYTSVAISPNYPSDQTVFVSAPQTRILRSQHGGELWEPVCSGLPPDDGDSYMRSLAISPNFANDQTIFAVVAYSGIYRCTNAVEACSQVHWNLVYPSASVNSLSISPDYAKDNTIFAIVGYSGDGSQNIIVSKNGGDTWLLLNYTGLPLEVRNGSRKLVASPNFSNDHRIFLGTSDDGVWTTTLNSRPVATYDTFSIDEDQVLDVVTPGVLGNDYDEYGDPITAVLVKEPDNGTLTLNSNGSFNYVPNTDFNGTDMFIYKANDGLLDSDWAMVNISVNMVNDPPVALADGPILAIAGDPVKLDASASSDTEGAPLSFMWNFGDESTLQTTDAIVEHTYLSTGIFDVTLVVNDGDLDSYPFGTTANIAAPSSGGRDDVNAFLSYISIVGKRIDLPIDTTSFEMTVIYGPTIDTSSFEAILNKDPDLVLGFHPIANTMETVEIPLTSGRNVLVLKVDGIRSDGRTATDRDRLTFIVP